MENTSKICFYAGTTNDGKGINYLYGEVDGTELYAECYVPENASEDYGYIALAKDIVKQAEEAGIPMEAYTLWYDGQEQFLAEDAKAECNVRRY